MKLGWWLPIALVAASPAAAAPRGEVPIALTLSSWGRPFLAWSIAADGRISLAKATANAPPPGPLPLATRRTGPAPAHYAWVVRALADARLKAGSDLACQPEVTDLPYGELRWGQGRGAPTLSFYTRCREADTRALVDHVLAVTKQIQAWVDAAGVDKDKPAGVPR